MPRIGCHIVGQRGIARSIPLSCGTHTGNGNSYLTPVSVKAASEAVLFLNITAVSGTNPSLRVYLMTKDTIAKEWHEIGKFNKKSSPERDIAFIINGLGSYIGCAWEIEGTDNPSFTFTVNASIKE